MSTERAVETLLRTDPEFGALLDVLYGPDTNAQDVYDDVFGVSKKELSPQQKSEQLQARIGLASNYLGLAAGTAGVVAASKNPALKLKGAKKANAGPVTRRAIKHVKTPRGRARLIQAGAGAALGLQLANVAGDTITNRVLGRSAHANVEKSAGTALRATGRYTHQSVKALASGVADSWKKAEHFATKATEVTPEMSAARKKSAEGAQMVGASIRHPIEGVRRKPKTALAITGTTTYVAGKSKGRKQQAEDTYYGKSADFVAEGEFTKFDTDKRLAFGWASVVKKDGVDVVDRQGDYMTIDDIEDAAYKYVMTSRVGGDMHKRNGAVPHHVSDMVESFVVTPEKVAKMGLPENTPLGWWVGFKIHDDQAWQEVKVGKKVGFSIHGKGKRADHMLDGY